MSLSNFQALVRPKPKKPSNDRRRESIDNESLESSLYRRESNISNASFISDVEMAHDEMFAGPISESVPSSVTGFAHRRPRAESVSSFTYFQEEDESPEWPEDQTSIEGVREDAEERSSLDEGLHEDVEQGLGSLPRRKSSGFSEFSANNPLLGRHDSVRSSNSISKRGKRFSQKIYVVNEDLTLVVAGFSSKRFGLMIYLAICGITLGIGYLVLRWLPRWRVWLTGTPSLLCDCDWVVIENEWSQFEVRPITRTPYGYASSTIFGLNRHKWAVHDYEFDDDPVLLYLRFLNYRYLKFCFNPLEDKFMLCSEWRDSLWTDVKSLRTGLDSDERHRRSSLFGRNDIEIEQKSIPQLLIDEALHPFYVFQIASFTLWSLDEYYYYAVCIFLISIVSVTTTLIETRSTMKRLREMSHFGCEVRVLRNGFWRQMDSGELVPGDVYEVSDPSMSQLPCDSLLLAGDCIVNESMLTGESVPVSKIPATNESLRQLNFDLTRICSEVARSFLFCGTKVIRARRPEEGQDDEAVALAVAVRTGFDTTKGALVRSMLFPKPVGFKLYTDAFRYISVMAGVAGLGFIVSFINFVRLGLTWHLILVRALDLITIIVPPALPATLSIGTNFALSRLKKKSVFCISPQRVNVGGKLDAICFDKTGTLTEDGLDVLGVRLVQRPSMGFSEIFCDSSALLPGPHDQDPTIDYEVHKAVLSTMATCHSLRAIDDELLGDPLDIKMFEFTGWSFKEIYPKTNSVDEEGILQSPSAVARPPPELNYDVGNPKNDSNPRPIELSTLKSFEFVSQLRRASVVVGQSGSSLGYAYVKGAPECMKDICNRNSFPPDYEELLAFYTNRGFRVIACATKEIPSLNWQMLDKLKRQDIESGLDFLGFIIFENKLKAATTSVIDELNNARIRNIMCTGDNVLTAISVARECNLIDRNTHCFVPQFADDSRATLRWCSVDNALIQLDEHTLMPTGADFSSPLVMSNTQNYSLAVTGDAFRYIVDFGSESVLKRA